MRRSLAVVAAVFTLSGCYHVTVNTGVAPGTRTISQPFANGFVYGLVPPPTVDAMNECGNAGVARVETQQSFVNGLVSVLTLGIYTPWSIDVLCGAGEEQDTDAPDAEAPDASTASDAKPADGR